MPSLSVFCLRGDKTKFSWLKAGEALKIKTQKLKTKKQNQILMIRGRRSIEDKNKEKQKNKFSWLEAGEALEIQMGGRTRAVAEQLSRLESSDSV